MAQDTSDVREAIERDRAELAETVEALAAKADVGARVREKVSVSAEQVQHKAAELGDHIRQITPDTARAGAETVVSNVQERPFPYAVTGALVAGIVIGWRWARRHYT